MFGTLDQSKGCLIVYHEQKKDKLYGKSTDCIGNLLQVVHKLNQASFTLKKTTWSYCQHVLTYFQINWSIIISVWKKIQACFFFSACWLSSHEILCYLWSLLRVLWLPARHLEWFQWQPSTLVINPNWPWSNEDLIQGSNLVQSFILLICGVCGWVAWFIPTQVWSFVALLRFGGRGSWFILPIRYSYCRQPISSYFYESFEYNQFPRVRSLCHKSFFFEPVISELPHLCPAQSFICFLSVVWTFS